MKWYPSLLKVGVAQAVGQAARTPTGVVRAGLRAAGLEMAVMIVSGVRSRSAAWRRPLARPTAPKPASGRRLQRARS